MSNPVRNLPVRVDTPPAARRSRKAKGTEVARVTVLNFASVARLNLARELGRDLAVSWDGRTLTLITEEMPRG